MQITLKEKNLKHFRIGRQLDFNIEGVGYLRKAIDDVRPKLAERVNKSLEQMAKEFVEGTHPNCRCVVVGITTEKEKPVDKKKLKQFYIGKRYCVCEGTDLQQWGKDTLPEAIEQAKQLAEDTGEPQYIVKVIKVVRKKPQPVVVEDVK